MCGRRKCEKWEATITEYLLRLLNICFVSSVVSSDSESICTGFRYEKNIGVVDEMYGKM